MNRAAQLEKQIKVLIDDSVSLLKARMNELGINANSPGDLLAKAKEIVCRHKELQAKASKLQSLVLQLIYMIKFCFYCPVSFTGIKPGARSSPFSNAA